MMMCSHVGLSLQRRFEPAHGPTRKGAVVNEMILQTVRLFGEAAAARRLGDLPLPWCIVGDVVVVVHSNATSRATCGLPPE